MVEESHSKNSGSSKGLTKEKLDEYRRIMKADQEPPRGPEPRDIRSNLDVLNDLTHLDGSTIEEVLDSHIFGSLELRRMERIAAMIRLMARGVKEAQIYRRFVISNDRGTVADCLQAAKDWTHDHPKGYAELQRREKN